MCVNVSLNGSMCKSMYVHQLDLQKDPTNLGLQEILHLWRDAKPSVPQYWGEIAELCSEIKIKMIRTYPYYPQAHDKVERAGGLSLCTSAQTIWHSWTLHSQTENH